MATWSQLEEVEGRDGRGLNTGDVAEGTDELLAIGLWVVDNQWAAALSVSSVPQFTLTGTNLAGLLDLDEILAGAKGLEERNGSLGLDDSIVLEGLGVDDQWDFWDVGNAVTTGEKKGGDGGGSNGGCGSESPIR